MRGFQEYAYVCFWPKADIQFPETPPTFSPGSFPRPVQVGVMHIHELHHLSQLIVEIGDWFMVRRTMQRLEARELTLQEAIELLSTQTGD